MVKETKEEKEIRERKEISYGSNMILAQAKNKYITNIINGRYFFARCNMMAEQLHPSGEIKESIDGCLKSEEYLRAEYALTKMQAIVSMRNAHFAKQELFKDFKLTDKDIEVIEEDYYNGKIIRESYDESYKKGNKAEFVHSSKD